MSYWKQIFIPLVFWMSGYWIDTLAVPPVNAEPPATSMHEYTPRQREHGFSLKIPDHSEIVLAPLLNTRVTITISGSIARTTVSQQFSNPSEQWAEGVYVFPLPNQAAVDHLRMKIGERIIEGQIQERAQAKQTYAKAKAKGQRASLVEQERPNIFTTSVANIAPHAPITIDIEYQEMVRYDQGRFHFVFQWLWARVISLGSPQTFKIRLYPHPAWGGHPIPIRFQMPPTSLRLYSILPMGS